MPQDYAARKKVQDKNCKTRYILYMGHGGYMNRILSILYMGHKLQPRI